MKERERELKEKIPRSEKKKMKKGREIEKLRGSLKKKKTKQKRRKRRQGV